MSVAAIRQPVPEAGLAAFEAGAARLSTDYLNRHSEALMLLELVPMDREVLADLRDWRAMSYREHFDSSSLRCAGEALRAYDALDKVEVEAFENLCAAMNRLIRTVTALLDEMPESEDPALVVEVASLSLRRLLARATAFINANGAGETPRGAASAMQAEIDRLMAG